MRLLSCLATTLAIFFATHDLVGNEYGRTARTTIHNRDFVVTAPTKELARTILQKADQFRRELARKWLGREIPPGKGQALISVTVTNTTDSGLTWPVPGPHDSTSMVYLKSTEQNVTGPLLAHEMTHVVLAEFAQQLPAWVDEGIASLQDDVRRKTMRQEILDSFATEGDWPSIQDVLARERLMPQDQAGYTVASSLVTFLLSRGNRATLLKFAAEGARLGWNGATGKYYNIPNTNQLQREWQHWVTRQQRMKQVDGAFPIVR